MVADFAYYHFNNLSGKLNWSRRNSMHGSISWTKMTKADDKDYNTGSARGGSGIPVYPKKNSPKYPKIAKIHPNVPKIIPRYTLCLKFKESDIPNTRI